MDKTRWREIEKALEGMQKQDKALYSKLLTLQESIRGLKNELKKERDEVFKDLEEISGAEFEDDVFLEGNDSNEAFSEKNENAFNTQEQWKHDRQDSGISVKTPEVESQDSLTATSKHHTPMLDFVKSSTPSEGFKPELISANKQDLNPHVKTINAELPQKKTWNTKPVIIQHNKQDSGILIDEDAVKDTTLLSKLVESSEMLEKLENRKFDRIIQKEWMKVREDSLGNRGSKFHHQRSRSSNDLLKSQPQRSLPHQVSTPSLQPRHSHTSSCPQTLRKQSTTQAKEDNVENPHFKQFIELDKSKDRLSINHSRIGSCPQTIINTAQRDVQTFKKPSVKRPNELNQVKSENQQSELLDNVEQPHKSNKKLQTPRKVDGSHQNHPKAFTANNRTILSLPISPGSVNRASKSVFKQNVFSVKHHHTRSLPSTPVRELIVAENLLSRQENRRSMENISECNVMTSKQVRPRKRSASFVDLDSLGDDGKIDDTHGRRTSREVSGLQVDSSKQAKESVLTQGKVSPMTDVKSFTPQKGNVIQNDSWKQTRENDMSQHKDNLPTPHKTNVVQADSFSVLNETRNSNLTQSKDTLTQHKACVVRVNSLSQGIEKTQDKARVVNHLQENNVIQNQTNGELKALKPLRAVLVSATEVNISNISDKQPLSRRCSLDEKGSGIYRPSDGPKRRFTITNFKTERRSQTENGELSSRFLTPKNHLRHHTMPEYDVMRRRHSLYAFHAPSKSWDGYSSRKSSEVKGMVRSASQVSLV